MRDFAVALRDMLQAEVDLVAKGAWIRLQSARSAMETTCKEAFLN
jgi:hypothetical protein